MRPVPWAFALIFVVALARKADRVVITDITDSPRLTFFPTGTILHVGAFGRITSAVNYGTVTKHCLQAADDMGTDLGKHLKEDSWAHQFYSESPNFRKFYKSAANKLRASCTSLQQWNTTNAFFAVNDQMPQKNNRQQRATNAQDKEETLKAFASAPPVIRESIVDLPHTGTINASLTGNRAARGIPAVIIGAAAAIVGGATLIMTVYKLLMGTSQPTWQQHAVAEDTTSAVQQNTFAIRALLASVNEVHHMDHFHLYINSIIDHANEISQITMHIQEALFQLQQGNISPVFVNPQDLQDAVELLAKQAYGLHMKLAIQSAADALLMPAFGMINSTHVTVILPVPAYTISLDIHQFAGNPLLIQEGEEFILLQPLPTHSSIAVAQRSPQHMLISDQELAKCFNVYNTYMCSEAPLFLDREDSCLGALFTANADAIHRHCAFQPHHSPWHISQAYTGNHVLSTAKALSATTACHDGSSKANPLTRGVYLLRVPPGCTTQTESFLVETPYRDFSEVQITKHLTWNMKAPVFWANSSVEQNLQRALNHAAQADQSLSAARKLLQSTSSSPWWTHASWGSILLLVTTILAAIFFWKYRAVARTLQERAQQGITANLYQQPPATNATAIAKPAASYRPPNAITLSL